MKKFPFLFAALAFALSIAAATPAMAQATYEIDPGHSQVVFKIRHLGVSDNFGRFNVIEGSVKWDPAKLQSSSIDVKVPADSVDTFDEKRDQHLRSNDFFNTKQFPVITFKSKSITRKQGNVYTVTGDLMLHGVTKSITTDFEFIGEGKDPWGGFRVGGLATFTINRSDFGMDYMVSIGAVGDKVTLWVNLEAVRK